MHVTLVWTDPPGNPAVLQTRQMTSDLVVHESDTGATDVYIGNKLRQRHVLHLAH